jgi:hypothetical protein
MTLLEEIQTAAVDATVDLSTLLRKCKLLAARLGSRQLEDWVLWESNGYPTGTTVPEYRIWPLQVKGHFFGPYGSKIENAPIPHACLPDKARPFYAAYECRQSIASIESTLKVGSQQTVRVGTGDLALTLGGNVYEHHNCVQAWAEFPVGQLVEVTNAVQNRILDFTLAVWKEAPEAGELGVTGPTTLGEQRMTQIFNTTVYGGNANLVGSASASSISFNIGVRDFPSLQQALAANGVAPEAVAELQAALDDEPEVQPDKKLGPKVSNWIAKMVGSAASGTWNIGIGAAGNLLATLVGKYYGIS